MSETAKDSDENKTWREITGGIRDGFDARIWVSTYERHVAKFGNVDDATNEADRAVYEFRQRVNGRRIDANR